MNLVHILTYSFSKIHFNIVLPLFLGPQVISSLQVFKIKLCMHFFHAYCMPCSAHHKIHGNLTVIMSKPETVWSGGNALNLYSGTQFKVWSVTGYSGAT
jgi:hypothetical protein